MEKHEDRFVCLNINMKKIILLTGGGTLPEEVIRSLKRKKIKFFCIIFKNNPVSKFILNHEYKLINFGKIISELKILKNSGFKKILMIGNLKRPNLADIKPDINSIKLIPSFTNMLLKGGDNNLLAFCINQLSLLGFEVLDLRKIIPENFLNFGNQTNVSLSEVNMNDIKKGKRILDYISKFDIGQSIIMNKGNVIGIEAAQGTDNLIKESKVHLNKNEKSILIKLVKVKQNLKADLPTIGIKTVRNCRKSNVAGIAYSANKTLFLKKQKIVEYCNDNNIFLFGV